LYLQEDNLFSAIGPIIERTLLISAGAVVGANTRYLVADWAARKWGTGFPYGTFIINVTGSLLIGIFIAVTSERFLIDPRWRLLFVVGFLGAYTTYSTYTLECMNMFERGQWGLGVLDMIGSVLLGIAAVGIGIFIGRIL
jgi:fluoride exporter